MKMLTKILCAVMAAMMLLTLSTAFAEDSDLAYVKNKGTLIVGITDFAPMDYRDESGNWIGFDADLARAFAAYLGVEVQFVEINWDYKEQELNDKNIDCIWNGMTLTEGVKATMATSVAYMNNAQVIVVKADVADQYQDVNNLTGKSVAVEEGSAGDEIATSMGLNVLPVASQADTLLEVSSGSSDVAIIDSLMAAAMVGEGTNYANLTYTVGLNSEEYGVGFRMGSDLVEVLNEYLAASLADGTMEAIAVTYGVQAALIK